MAGVSDLFGPAPGDAVYDEMVDLRHEVHRRPELAFAEHHTTGLIRDHMAALEIPESLRVTETGGIFTLEGGRPGRCVVLRADIDALPVQEDQARAVTSEVEGVMHACGHDVHVAALLGAATALARRREDLPGRYVFLFQPGEEALCGAKAMVEGGALAAMDRARLVGFHVTSQIPTGLVAVRGGVTMSEAHSLRISLTGPGGHGAMPTGQGDVIRATAELVGRLGEVVEGLSYEEANCVCSAGTLAAGTAVNVVPTSARVTGTLRTFTSPQREEALARLRALCAAVADAQGVEVRPAAARAHAGRGQRPGGGGPGRGRGRNRPRRGPGVPHAAVGTERRRERVPQPPPGLLLLRGGRRRRRLERHAPQPDLFGGGRLAPRRGRRHGAQRGGAGRAVAAIGIGAHP